jgi:predicted nucleic acid-binding protein
LITADTNVLIYLWDNQAPAKMSVATQVTAFLAARSWPLALQVIGETQNVLRRKLRQPPWQAAQNARNLLTMFPSFQASADNAGESLTLMAAGRLSYWDAMLVAAARDTGCDVLLSEDMQDGARYGSLEIVNPFGAAGPSDRLKTLMTP